MFSLVLELQSRGVKNDSILYVEQIILTYVSVYGGIVNPCIDGFLYCPSKVLLLPAHSVEDFQSEGVACGGMVVVDRWRCL